MPLPPPWLSRARVALAATTAFTVVVWTLWRRRRQPGKETPCQEAAADASNSSATCTEAKEADPMAVLGTSLQVQEADSDSSCSESPCLDSVPLIATAKSPGIAVARRVVVPKLRLGSQLHRRASLGPEDRSARLGSSRLGSSRLGSARIRSARRLSKQFLSYCMCDDDDFWSAPSHESEDFNTPPSSPGFFRMDGNDSEKDEGEDCGDKVLTLEEVFSFNLGHVGNQNDLELEDLFSFDLDKVAEALRFGHDLAQLQEIIEESMKANLELRTANPTLPSLAEPSPLMAGDLSGRMTPGRMTPKSCDSDEKATSTAAGVPQHFQSLGHILSKRVAVVPTPSRRSRRHRASIVQRRLSKAVEESCVQNRQDLASAAAKECRVQIEGSDESINTHELTAVVQECVVKSHKQHRQSLLQAAEVVELATVREENALSEEWGADNLTPHQLTEQLQLVQKAIERARQHHRQSISKTFNSGVDVRGSPSSNASSTLL